MKKVFITGGNKGIGLETAKLFSDAGYEVTVLGRDFSSFPLKESKNVKTVVFDVANISEIGALVKEIGDTDILINNAGMMYSVPYDNYPADKRERLMNVNLYAPVEFITHFSKGMLERKSGRIVSVASVAGQIGHPDIWYGASKAGLINATKSFAKIFAPSGVVINAVAPGPTLTDMMSVIPEDRKKYMKSNTYTNRFASPAEIAKTIFWLATDAPEYINGFCIDMNNGVFPR